MSAAEKIVDKQLELEAISATVEKIESIGQSIPGLEALRKLLSAYVKFISIQVYCGTLSLQVHEEIKEYFFKSKKYLKLVVDMPVKTFTVDRFIKLQESIKALFQAVQTRANNFTDKFVPASRKIIAELEKTQEPEEMKKLVTIANKDPLGIEAEIEKFVRIADEAKSQLDSFNEEWKEMKGYLHGQIDGCIEMTSLLIKAINVWKQEAVEH